MERYVALGFSDAKMNVGASLDVDVQRVRAAREVLGPQRRLALDSNNGYKSLPEALRAARAFQPFDPWWFEEPLSPDNVAGHAELARQIEIPVATGEIHQMRWEFRALLESRAAAILQPDAGVLGGVSEWQKERMPPRRLMCRWRLWHADLHVHLAAAASNCWTVEYFLLQEDIYNFERLLSERLQPRDGRIALPQKPCIGLSLDSEAIARYTLP